MARFFVKYGGYLSFIFMGASLAFLVAIESVFNGGFSLAIRALWLPLGVAVFGVTWWLRHDFQKILRRRWTPWITAMLLYPILLLMSWPYVMAINALLPSRGEVCYEGPITRKWISHGRYPRYHVVIRDQSTERDVTLNLPQRRFERLSTGDRIKKTFLVGGFGVPFRWRYGK